MGLTMKLNGLFLLWHKLIQQKIAIFKCKRYCPAIFIYHLWRKLSFKHCQRDFKFLNDIIFSQIKNEIVCHINFFHSRKRPLFGPTRMQKSYWVRFEWTFDIKLALRWQELYNLLHHEQMCELTLISKLEGDDQPSHLITQCSIFQIPNSKFWIPNF